MTLQQRIQQSAAELGRLLRQAEKQHRRFLKHRDAKMQVSDPWPPDGNPLVFIVHTSGIDVEISSREIATTVYKALAEHGTRHEVPFDNGKAFVKVAPQTQPTPVSASDASPLFSVASPSDKEDFAPDSAAAAEKPANPYVEHQQYRRLYHSEVLRLRQLEKRLRADMARFSQSIAESAGSSR